MARVALWGGSRFGAAGGDLECVFLQEEVRGTSFSGVRYKQLVRIAVDRCFSAVKLVYKGHTIKDGSRLSEQWGKQMPGNAMERGALGGECDLEPRGSAFPWASYMVRPSFTYKCGIMLILKYSPCIAVAVQ